MSPCPTCGPHVSSPSTISVQETAANFEPSPTTTVQLGENSLSQVAHRLAIDKDTLLQANPKITDPQNLSVGQEIQLPSNPQPPALDGSSKDPGYESGRHNNHDTVRVNDLPKAPFGDPLVAIMMRESLLQAKVAKIDAEINSIGNQLKESDQKAQDVIDAASEQMTLSIASGAANAASAMQSTTDSPQAPKHHIVDTIARKP